MAKYDGMTTNEKIVADALDWAYRSGYTHGEKAMGCFAHIIGAEVKARSLGVYGDTLEVEKLP